VLAGSSWQLRASRGKSHPALSCKAGWWLGRLSLVIEKSLGMARVADPGAARAAKVKRAACIFMMAKLEHRERFEGLGVRTPRRPPPAED